MPAKPAISAGRAEESSPHVNRQVTSATGRHFFDRLLPSLQEAFVADAIAKFLQSMQAGGLSPLIHEGIQADAFPIWQQRLSMLERFGFTNPRRTVQKRDQIAPWIAGVVRTYAAASQIKLPRTSSCARIRICCKSPIWSLAAGNIVVVGQKLANASGSVAQSSARTVASARRIALRRLPCGLYRDTGSVQVSWHAAAPATPAGETASSLRAAAGGHSRPFYLPFQASESISGRSVRGRS